MYEPKESNLLSRVYDIAKKPAKLALAGTLAFTLYACGGGTGGGSGGGSGGGGSGKITYQQAKQAIDSIVADVEASSNTPITITKLGGIPVLSNPINNLLKQTYGVIILPQVADNDIETITSTGDYRIETIANNNNDIHNPFTGVHGSSVGTNKKMKTIYLVKDDNDMLNRYGAAIVALANTGDGTYFGDVGETAAGSINLFSSVSDTESELKEVFELRVGYFDSVTTNLTPSLNANDTGGFVGLPFNIPAVSNSTDIDGTLASCLVDKFNDGTDVVTESPTDGVVSVTYPGQGTFFPKFECTDNEGGKTSKLLFINISNL